MITRRFFLGGLLVGAAAPAIVRAESIMRLAPPKGWVLEGGLLVAGELVGADITTDQLVVRGYVPYWDAEGKVHWHMVGGSSI